MAVAKMTATEKLAREICWAGFTRSAKEMGFTKASYWKSIADDARDSYMEEAKHFAFLVRRIDVNVLNELS